MNLPVSSAPFAWSATPLTLCEHPPTPCQSTLLSHPQRPLDTAFRSIFYLILYLFFLLSRWEGQGRGCLPIEVESADKLNAFVGMFYRLKFWQVNILTRSFSCKTYFLNVLDCLRCYINELNNLKYVLVVLTINQPLMYNCHHHSNEWPGLINFIANLKSFNFSFI